MKTRGASSSRAESGKTPVSEGGGEQVTNNSVALGEMVFIKLRGGSWWPAQVVDANSVNKNLKPRKRSAGEVLVRLYGSYTYSYTDPMKYQSEFEVMLKNNNGSYRDIIQQSLEKDLPSTKASRSKGSSSKTEGTTTKSPSRKRKSSQNDDDLGSQNPETDALGKSQELSARRVRVMKSLGLIAPPGSPFHKNGHISEQNS